MKQLLNLLILTFCFSNLANAEIVGTWTCGDDCTATLDDKGNFVISGSGKMRDYTREERDTILPWRNYRSQIKSIEVQGISYIGSDSLSLTGATEIKIDNTVTGIGRAALEFNHSLTSIELPESLTKLNYSAYAWNENLTKIIIPDSITSVEHLSVGSWPEKLQIICKGSNCDNVKKLLKNYTYLSSTNSDTILTADLSNKVILAEEPQCTGTKYYWTGKNCNNRPTNGEGIECAEGYYVAYRNYNEVCEKIKLRYTMQEADEATSDDFENRIEWIFE